VRNRKLERFELDKRVVSDFVLDVLVPSVGVHPYPLDELMLLAGAVCWQKPTHIFEWGTSRGVSALVFWETTRHFAIPARIVSVDLPDETKHLEHPGSSRGILVRDREGIELLQGDGLETSLAVCRSLGEGSRVLFFLDGDHAFDSVARELTSITQEVPHAAVLVHDTFLQASESRYNVGPYRAIDHVLGALDDGRYERITASTGLPGMTLLIPRA
jgi:cephalosporin hydroxylase